MGCMVNVLQKSIKPFLRFSTKRLKSRIVLNLLRSDIKKNSRCRLREIKKTQTDRTSMASKHNFKVRLVSFGAISLKQCSFFSPFHFFKQKSWVEMFSRFIRDQEYRLFYSCTCIILRNWRQLFYNRSGSYKIYVSPISFFIVWKHWLPFNQN